VTQAARLREELFFVVGHHRGGTTLLQSMLSSHPRLTLPPETQFFLEVWPRRARLGDLSDPAARRRVAAFLGSERCSVRDLGLDPGEVLAALPAGRPDYSDLFAALLEVWARSRGKPRAGEKSPGHIHCVPLLAGLYPKARFVACLRDPRGVAASELHAEWGTRSVDKIASRWNRVFDQHQRLARALPAERYLMLRYEDLVARPEAELARVCAFLGEEPAPGMLRYFERPAVELGFDRSERWKYATLRPLDPARLSAWREELSPGQIALVERAVGPRLTALGYVPSGVPAPSALQAARARLRDRLPWALEVLTGAARRKRGPRRRRE
jgi:hypothetical protein